MYTLCNISCACKPPCPSYSLLHIHNDAEVDLDEVVNCYARLHPRIIELESICAEFCVKCVNNLIAGIVVS